MKSVHYSRAALLVGAAFLAVVWWCWPRAATVEGSTVPGSPIGSLPPVPAVGADREPAGAVATKSGAEVEPPLAASLRGTDVDGQIDTGPGGHLVVSLGLRHLFDYFLAAGGEVSEAISEARIAAAINRSVQDPAASEARDVLHRYLMWRQHASTSATPDAGLSSALPDRFAELVASRRRFFSAAEAEALWGEEERATEAALRRHEIANDSGLDDATRAKKLAEADGLRPAATRAHEDAATRPLRQMDAEAQRRRAGATAAEVQAERVRAVGPAAAARLAAMDAEHSHWQARVDDFLQARRQILANPALSANQQVQAVDALRDQSFRGPERLRVRSFETPETAETPATSSDSKAP